ncbi:MAG TPA: sugar transporter, partial [Methylocella sp.]|nr:sugar transporter [Methylocella sp.]
FDMHSATAMFVAQRFQMQSRDLLYISDAPIANFRKMMEIVGLVTQPAMTGLTTLAIINRLNN